MFDTYKDHFQEHIPLRPGAKYAHIVVLRKTESYAVFKTDGELNTARVRAGVKDQTLMTRLTIFKRKQTTPERLTGRALLRRYDLLPEEDVYNQKFTPDSPDSVLYGYAIGDSGSEKSKVYVDTAYSLTSYDKSHETMTLNAPFEDGTMTQGSTTTNRFSEQDHVIPEVYFPSVVTLRDPTPNGLAYVFNNIRRTKRYGAQTTRTGHVHNEILALIFADGEIFSNLRLVQAMYDEIGNEENVNVSKVTLKAVQELLKQEVVNHNIVEGNALYKVLSDLNETFTDSSKLKTFLSELYKDTKDYAKRVEENAKKR